MIYRYDYLTNMAVLGHETKKHHLKPMKCRVSTNKDSLRVVHYLGTLNYHIYQLVVQLFF